MGPAAVLSVPSAHAATKPVVPRSTVVVRHDFKHDVSPPLRSTPPGPYYLTKGNDNPGVIVHHTNAKDTVVQRKAVNTMPATALNFDGIAFPGVTCNCAPPDPNGAVGATQYVQIVNEGYQVFDKSTGSSVLGPVAISTIWSGFGGVCELSGHGDPVVIYDRAAGRWLVSQFAGASNPTTECIAISTTSDATGSYYRYGFTLGTNFFDYPKFGVWPDGYYMSMNIFDPTGTTFLGPEPFVFDRTSMLTGAAASYISPVGPLSGANSFLPADSEGATPPPAGAPEPFVSFPGSGTYTTYQFHTDWVTPANSTWTSVTSPAAAPFTQLCPTTRVCVPEPNGDHLDGLGDRLMFRLDYRNFGDHESIVGNYTVSVGGVAAVRWFELRNITSGTESVYQESTFSPDSTNRWMGSAAMDGSGDIAVGYSVSSSTVAPGLSYAGRLSSDPLNSLAQGEATLYPGQGSQLGTYNRWGDYSDLTVDPVDDCTFWYTGEYYPTGSTSFDWRTRIASFRFPTCGAPVSISKVADAPSVPMGSSIGFTVTLANHTSTDATGLAVTDPLPAGTGVSWVIDPALTDAGWSVSGTAPTQTLVYAPTTLAANSVSRVHITSVTIAGSCAAYLNTASFVTTSDGSGQASASETVTGTPSTAFSENFDSVTAPALPTGWTPTQGVNTLTAPAWATTASGADTAPNALFTSDPAGLLDNMVTSPLIAIATTNAQLTFRNDYATENTYDGGVLDISIDGNPFTDILAAGGSFSSGGYNNTISSAYSNPLAGRQAWSGSSGGYITTSVNLPAAAAGHVVQLRWRFGSDTSVSSTGWWVDGVALTDGSTCGTQTRPVVTRQPAAQTVTAPASYSFTVAASGTPAPTVQWQRSNDGGVSFTNIAGATKKTYTAASTAADNGAVFRAVFVSSAGAAVSNPALLTVTAAPLVTTQPASTTLYVGQTWTFSAAASGVPAPTVQWQVSTDGGVTFAAVPGATSTTLSGVAALTDTGKQFEAVFTNSVGSATTQPATLTVNAPTVPGAPSVTAAASSIGAISVSYSPPSSDGGSAILAYRAKCTSSTGGKAVTTPFSTADPIVVSGVSAGQTYTCTAAALNLVGVGASSPASSAVVVPSVPGAPAITSAVAGVKAITITFTAPTNTGGLTITGYQAACVSSNGGVARTFAYGLVDPVTVSALTTGKTYTCTVSAINAAGTGAASAASTAVVVQ